MENVDLYSVSSMRRNRSVWRNSISEAFVKSPHLEDDDDEEALTWAVIEKLPTYSRLTKGLIPGEGGGSTEVDIRNLRPHERRILLDRLLKVADEDHEKFLLKLKDRIDSVGLDLVTIEVRYEHLKVNAEVYVGARALPTLLNFSINMIERCLGCLGVLHSKKKPFSILDDVSGIIRPSRMTLLLGPPSSGKTTLLLALAGKLDSHLKVSGRVTYNGHGLNEFVPQRTSAYISQHDLHIGEMTVRETLAFSARCQGVGTNHEMLAELSRREKAANIKPDPTLDAFMKAVANKGKDHSVVTDYILKLMGLDVCADTLVGDNMLRGISGGQRRRVTTAEMLVGPAKALFMDEISTGLDSSTTFQIVNALRLSNHIFHGTCIVSLLQPPPETYELFDDLILLADGQIIYQGPCEHVLEFFESMGFKCPDRKGVADFLQEVTSRKDQKQYWVPQDVPYSFVPVKEFAKAFQSFHVGRNLANELAIPFDKSKCHPAALTRKKYGVNKRELLRVCISREWLLMKRNNFVYIFKLCQLIFMAFVTMTTFLRTNMSHDLPGGGIYLGALFFGLTTIMFNGMAELNMTIVKLPVFYKQRDLLFYPAWALSLPMWIMKVPISFIEAGVWVSITYYAIGFDPSIFRLFRQYFLLVFVNQAASGMFRFIAAVGRDMTVTNTFCTFSLVVIMLLGGFLLSRDDMKKWWIWGYWISPLMYGQNGLAANAFLGKAWRHVVPNSNQTVGMTILKSRGFFPKAYWYWIGVGALCGYMFLFNGLFTLALAYLNPFSKHQVVLLEETVNEQADSIAGEGTDMSSRATTSNNSSSVGGEQASNSPSMRTDAMQAANQKKLGMVLPFRPLSITFDSITYSVNIPKEMRSEDSSENRLALLKCVSGAFRPGILTALMGVSGAGKTTLMDVLAGRKTGGYLDGSVTISGYPKKQETFARISGYCEQNDIHTPHVTVYESLVYSSWLRLPPEVDPKSRKEFVEDVMELVELSPLRGAIVGLPGTSGLSTEQRKRLTIAVELVANPSIVFMDEPTSGLDARAAAIVMRTVRNTVDTGRTVVCTIHQPSIDIFEAFDELFLMKRGGEVIYAGPLGTHSCHLVSYFEGVEGVSRIKDGYNPATWMLEITTGSQEERLNIDFAEVYKNSELCERNKALIKELSTPPPGSTDLHFSSRYSQSFFTQFIACLWKQYWSYWRNPQYNAVRLSVTTVISLLFGSIFWDLGSKRGKKQDLFNAMGSMYSAVLFLGVQNASSVQPVVAVERTVFYRERAARMYSPLAYALGQVMIEIPYVFIQTILYGVIVYSMLGFEWTVAKFFWYFFFMFFTLLYFTFYGMMAVAATPNQQIGAVVSSAFYGLWNLFSGFLIPRTRIPIWWRWYYWLSPVAWTLYGLVVSQYGDVTDRMDNGKQVKDFIRDYFGFRHDFLPVVAGVIVGFAVWFSFVFAFSISVINFQKR